MFSVLINHMKKRLVIQADELIYLVFMVSNAF